MERLAKLAQTLRWNLPRFYLRHTESPYNTPLLSMIFLVAFCVGSKLIYYDYINLGACGLRESTGIPCPGCGGTRATIAYFNGQWLSALSYNPLAFGFCFIWSLQGLNLLSYRFFKTRVHVRWRYFSYSARVIAAAAVFLLNWWVVIELSKHWVE